MPGMIKRRLALVPSHPSGKNTGGQAASATRTSGTQVTGARAKLRVARANLFARVFRYSKTTGKLLLAHATSLLACATHALGHSTRSIVRLPTRRADRHSTRPAFRLAIRPSIGLAVLVTVLAFATMFTGLGASGEACGTDFPVGQDGLESPSHSSAPNSDDTATAKGTGETRPQRIITIAPNSAEIICALGACDRIVGVSKYCVFPPELKTRTRTGGLFDPDLERIVSLRPDLVVLRGKSESLEGLCRERGIELYHDETDTLAGVEQCIRELGKRLGLSKKAASLASGFRARLREIEARTTSRKKPRVMLTVARQPDRLANLLTTGKGTFLDEMVTLAGGVNVFGDLDMRYPQVSVEAIVAHRPDVIIELMPEVEITPERRKRLLGQWKVLGPIPAVANGRVYFVSDDHCLIPSPRYTQVIEKISRLLHPEADHAPPLPRGDSGGSRR